MESFMSFFPHVIIGAAVGSFIPNPLGAALAGGVSHFVIDYIPHWDPVVYGRMPSDKKVLYGSLLFTDILLSVLVLIWISSYPNMLWAALAATIIDIDNFLQYQKSFFPKAFPILHTVFGISAHQPWSKWHKMTNIWLGLFNQGWITLLGLVVLYWRLYA